MTLIKSSYAETASNGGKISLAAIQLIRIPDDALWDQLFFLLAATIYYTAEWKYYCNNL